MENINMEMENEVKERKNGGSKIDPKVYEIAQHTSGFQTDEAKTKFAENVSSNSKISKDYVKNNSEKANSIKNENTQNEVSELDSKLKNLEANLNKAFVGEDYNKHYSLSQKISVNLLNTIAKTPILTKIKDNYLGKLHKEIEVKCLDETINNISESFESAKKLYDDTSNVQLRYSKEISHLKNQIRNDKEWAKTHHEIYNSMSDLKLKTEHEMLEARKKNDLDKFNELGDLILGYINDIHEAEQKRSDYSSNMESNIDLLTDKNTRYTSAILLKDAYGEKVREIKSSQVYLMDKAKDRKLGVAPIKLMEVYEDAKGIMNLKQKLIDDDKIGLRALNDIVGQSDSNINKSSDTSIIDKMQEDAKKRSLSKYHSAMETVNQYISGAI